MQAGLLNLHACRPGCSTCTHAGRALQVIELFWLSRQKDSAAVAGWMVLGQLLPQLGPGVEGRPALTPETADARAEALADAVLGADLQSPLDRHGDSQDPDSKHRGETEPQLTV